MNAGDWTRLRERLTAAGVDCRRATPDDLDHRALRVLVVWMLEQLAEQDVRIVWLQKWREIVEEEYGSNLADCAKREAERDGA